MTSFDDAKSDSGSDIDTGLSDYGSEFDREEENLIADLLQRIAATAPRAKSFVYSQVGGEHVPEPTILVHSSPPSAVVHQELAPTVAVEAEGDSPSHLYRRGTSPSTILCASP
jgi:exonuclease V